MFFFFFEMLSRMPSVMNAGQCMV